MKLPLEKQKLRQETGTCPQGHSKAIAGKETNSRGWRGQSPPLVVVRIQAHLARHCHRGLLRLRES